jgi:hypothetical protein
VQDIQIDGRLQATAGAVLLHRSRLLQWSSDAGEFVTVPHVAFEYSWRMDMDPAFGRLMCWIQFSAGAEFWLKGLCLLHDIDVRKEIEVAAYPTGDVDSWARRYNQNWRSDGSVRVSSFGTLGSLTWREGNALSFLDRLMTAGNAAPGEREVVRAACHLLAKSIRNRDAHGYVPNVRDSHHNLVPELFARCLNITAKWLPGGPDILNAWMAESKQFIAGIGPS